MPEQLGERVDVQHRAELADNFAVTRPNLLNSTWPILNSSDLTTKLFALLIYPAAKGLP